MSVEVRALERDRRPAAVAMIIPGLTGMSAAAERELTMYASVAQSAEPAFHLDSDADTAITGDVAGLAQRGVLRLLLNLSTRSERTLHYLDADPWSVSPQVQGAYVRVADESELHRYERTITIPRRCGSTVHAVAFTSNLVLHSGVDDAGGHFVAAYGSETAVAMGSG